MIGGGWGAVDSKLFEQLAACLLPRELGDWQWQSFKK